MTTTSSRVFPTCTSYEKDLLVTTTVVEVKTFTPLSFDEKIFETNNEYEKYVAKTSSVEVTFYANKTNPEFLYIKAIFANVKDLSGIHIHTNNDGESGPILAWLGTSVEWNSGITQNTPLTNYPCCNESSCQSTNKMCLLTSPVGTPLTNVLSFSTEKYIVKRSVCESCPWISNGARLDIHGKNFQQYINCEIIGDTPGIDMLESELFTPLRI